MKQVTKRKVKRVKRTDEVDFEISYKRDNGLDRRIDALLASIDCALDDAHGRNGCA